jgi:HAD superfamily hydrolase (TIGR01509 family)
MEKHSRVIFFDLYQTLLDVKISSTDPIVKLKEELVGWEASADELKKYGITIAANEFLKLYEKRRDDFYSANRGEKINHHNMQALIAEVLEKDFNTQRPTGELLNLVYTYRKASRGWLRLYPSVFETLSVLSKEYTLSTASHTQGSFTQLELRELNIEKFFSYFVYSSDIGLRKESPDFYKYALEATGRKAEDCIMVGDNYDVDILVPKQLGIQGIWIKNSLTSNRYPMEQEPPNTLALENFEELPNIVVSLFKNLP